MNKTDTLQRFLDAQATSYETALSEVGSGQKRSHWMWYVFPQIQGLGFSETAKYYAIKDLDEARAFLAHPVLGERLVRISEALLNLESNDATSVMGSPDDVKLKSSMTLFAALNNKLVFQRVLNKFFGGDVDKQTLQIIGKP